MQFAKILRIWFWKTYVTGIHFVMTPLQSITVVTCSGRQKTFADDWISFASFFDPITQSRFFFTDQRHQILFFYSYSHKLSVHKLYYYLMFMHTVTTLLVYGGKRGLLHCLPDIELFVCACTFWFHFNFADETLLRRFSLRFWDLWWIVTSLFATNHNTDTYPKFLSIFSTFEIFGDLIKIWCCQFLFEDTKTFLQRVETVKHTIGLKT